jgi:hypothetical protein
MPGLSSSMAAETCSGKNALEEQVLMVLKQFSKLLMEGILLQQVQPPMTEMQPVIMVTGIIGLLKLIVAAQFSGRNP